MPLFNQIAQISKRLISALKAFFLIAGVSIKNISRPLDWLLYIYYLLHFRKDKKNKMRVLINSGSKVNTMTLKYDAKIGLKICHIKIRAQKINGSIFDMFEIVFASF